MTATLFLMVGLPGAGKTTAARALETERRGIRFTPDEWMIPLFGESMAGGKRDVLEGRFVATALRALPLGVDVVLDFGLWGRDERWALHWLARSVGARCETRYLRIDAGEQAVRVVARFGAAANETFPMTPEELARWREQFEIPDASELAGDTPEVARPVRDLVPLGILALALPAVDLSGVRQPEVACSRRSGAEEDARQASRGWVETARRRGTHP